MAQQAGGVCCAGGLAAGPQVRGLEGGGVPRGRGVRGEERSGAGGGGALRRSRQAAYLHPTSAASSPAPTPCLCRPLPRWPELQPHFTKVWSMTLRCMDDIKETVRK